MLLRDVSYFAVLAVSIIAVSATTDRNESKASDEKQIRKLKKREVIVLDDLSESPYVRSKPAKVIYRKASRARYGKSKSKYGVQKSKYGPPPRRSRPQKKYKSKPITKYAPRTAYQKPKINYKPIKSTHTKPKPYYRPLKTFKQEAYSPPETTYVDQGFGEPPVSYAQNPKTQTYGEPPTNSFVTPAINTYHQYPTGQDFLHDQTHQNYHTGPDNNFNPGVSAQTQWHTDYAVNQPIYYDNNYANSQTRQIYTTANEAGPPENSVPDYETPNEEYGEQTEPFNPRPTVATYPRRNVKRKPSTYRNKKGSPTQYADEVVVGGKYAEPPARYVPKFHSSAPTYSEQGFSSVNNYMDSEMAGTAGSAVSSYVNYKNSNLAFSPQNLNDVFSIVD